MVFRQGTEPVSDVVMAMDNSGYSHVGMLVGEPDNWQVLHAIPEAGVTLEPLASFIAPEQASLHAIYHIEASHKLRQQAVAFAESRLGEPFRITAHDASIEIDHEASPSTGTYCTLLIHDAWLAAGLDLQASFKRINMPLARGDFLLPSGLQASPLTHLISQDTIISGDKNTDKQAQTEQ